MSKLQKCSINSFGNRIKRCDDCEFYKMSVTDYNMAHPKFSFIYLQNGYGLNKNQKDEKAALYDNLITRSKMTWSQIIFAPKHGLGQEIIPQEAIQPPIPSIVKRDTNILSLRYNGMKPIIGFRDKDVFHILWIDYNFTVYSHS